MVEVMNTIMLSCQPLANEVAYRGNVCLCSLVAVLNAFFEKQAAVSREVSLQVL